jgi:hypothetical protein
VWRRNWLPTFPLKEMKKKKKKKNMNESEK